MVHVLLEDPGPDWDTINTGDHRFGEQRMESGEVMGASSGARRQWPGDTELPSCRPGLSFSGNHDGIDHGSTEMPHTGRWLSEPLCIQSVVPDRWEAARRDAAPVPGGIRPRDDEPPLDKRVRFGSLLVECSTPGGEQQTQLISSPLTQLKLYESATMDCLSGENVSTITRSQQWVRYYFINLK